MFHSAFHLYFGALDIILYGAAFLVSLAVSRAICDDMDTAAPQSVSAAITAVVTTQEPSQALSNKLSPASAATSSVSLVVADENNGVVGSDDGDKKTVLRLANVQLYKLHKKSVIFADDIPFDVPDRIRCYTLRKQKVVRLEDLESFAEVIT